MPRDPVKLVEKPARDGASFGAPRPDHADAGREVDLGEMMCEKRGGLFVNVRRLVYACVFRNWMSPQHRNQGERSCEQSGGLFVDASALTYACVLPGGTLPDPFPALPLPE